MAKSAVRVAKKLKKDLKKVEKATRPTKVCVTCKKAPAKGRSPYCEPCRVEARKASWRKATINHNRNRLLADKSAEGKLVIRNEKPTFWAIHHPKEAIAVLKKTGREDYIGVVERAAKRAKAA